MAVGFLLALQTHENEPVPSDSSLLRLPKEVPCQDAVVRGVVEDRPPPQVFSMLRRLGSNIPLKDVYELLVQSYHDDGGNDDRKPQGLVIDVGLAHGDECFRTAELGLHCYGFEADPKSAQEIQTKAQGHPHSQRLHITSAAVGDQVQQVSFGSDVKNKFGVGGTLTAGKDGKEYVKVQMVRLDDQFQDEEEIFLLKTDTQGHELAVMRGAEQLIASRRIHFILFEAAVFLMPGKAADLVQIMEIMEKHDYLCVDLAWHKDRVRCLLRQLIPGLERL